MLPSPLYFTPSFHMSLLLVCSFSLTFSRKIEAYVVWICPICQVMLDPHVHVSVKEDILLLILYHIKSLLTQSSYRAKYADTRLELLRAIHRLPSQTTLEHFQHLTTRIWSHLIFIFTFLLSLTLQLHLALTRRLSFAVL